MTIVAQSFFFSATKKDGNLNIHWVTPNGEVDTHQSEIVNSRTFAGHEVLLMKNRDSRHYRCMVVNPPYSEITPIEDHHEMPAWVSECGRINDIDDPDDFIVIHGEIMMALASAKGELIRMSPPGNTEFNFCAKNATYTVAEEDGSYSYYLCCKDQVVHLRLKSQTLDLGKLTPDSSPCYIHKDQEGGVATKFYLLEKQHLFRKGYELKVRCARTTNDVLLEGAVVDIQPYSDLNYCDGYFTSDSNTHNVRLAELGNTAVDIGLLNVATTSDKSQRMRLFRLWCKTHSVDFNEIHQAFLQDKLAMFEGMDLTALLPKKHAPMVPSSAARVLVALCPSVLFSVREVTEKLSCLEPSYGLGRGGDPRSTKGTTVATLRYTDETQSDLEMDPRILFAQTYWRVHSSGNITHDSDQPMVMEARDREADGASKIALSFCIPSQLLLAPLGGKVIQSSAPQSVWNEELGCFVIPAQKNLISYEVITQASMSSSDVRWRDARTVRSIDPSVLCRFDRQTQQVILASYFLPPMQAFEVLHDHLRSSFFYNQDYCDIAGDHHLRPHVNTWLTSMRQMADFVRRHNNAAKTVLYSGVCAERAVLEATALYLSGFDARFVDGFVPTRCTNSLNSRGAHRDAYILVEAANGLFPLRCDNYQYQYSKAKRDAFLSAALKKLEEHGAPLGVFTTEEESIRSVLDIATSVDSPMVRRARALARLGIYSPNSDESKIEKTVVAARQCLQIAHLVMWVPPSLAVVVSGDLTSLPALSLEDYTDVVLWLLKSNLEDQAQLAKVKSCLPKTDTHVELLHALISHCVDILKEADSKASFRQDLIKSIGESGLVD